MRYVFNRLKMIQTLIGSFALFLIYNLFDKNNEQNIKWWILLSLILVPGTLKVFIHITINIIGLPSYYCFTSYILFLCYPILILTFYLRLSIDNTIHITSLVLFIIITTDILFWAFSNHQKLINN